MTMLKRKEIPSKPRFRYVIEKAHELLIEIGITSFPVDIDYVSEELSDRLDIISYSAAKGIMKADDPFNLHKLHTEARTLKPRYDSLALIVYDDTLNVPFSRIRWSIMHEIAHVILGHLDDFELTRLDRKSNSEYGVLEVEANFFVSEFLMPTPILKAINPDSPEKIASAFQVSEEASVKKYNMLLNSYRTEYKYSELLYRTFFNYIHPSDEKKYIPDSDFIEFDNWNYIREKLRGSFTEDILNGSSAYFDDEDHLLIYSPLILFDIRIKERVILDAIWEYTPYRPEIMLVYSTPDSRFKLVSSYVGAVKCTSPMPDILEDPNLELI